MTRFDQASAQFKEEVDRLGLLVATRRLWWKYRAPENQPPFSNDGGANSAHVRLMDARDRLIRTIPDLIEYAARCEVERDMWKARLLDEQARFAKAAAGLAEIARIIDADPEKDLVEEVREGVRLGDDGVVDHEAHRDAVGGISLVVFHDTAFDIMGEATTTLSVEQLAKLDDNDH